MTKTKRNVFLIGLAATGVFALSAQAQPPGPPPMMGPHHGGGFGPGRVIHVLLRSADLTADQQTQAHQILDANRSAVETIITNLRQANNDLANLLLGAPDVQADMLSTHLTKINGLQLQLEQQTANTVLAIRALLTPEQLAKAAAAETQMQARQGDFFGGED